MKLPRLSVAPSLLVVSAWALLGTAGCDSLPVPNPYDPTPLRPPIEQVMVSGPSSPVAPGQSVQFKGTVVFVGGATQDVTGNAQWSSSDPSVATVTGGAMRAIKAGETEIRATYENVTGRALVRVAGDQ